MQVFVTGATGFAGSHLVSCLLADGHAVGGLVRPMEAGGSYTFEPIVGDLLDQEAVRKAVEAIRPDVIYHLAGQADVGLSWKKPGETFALNTQGTIHVLQAALSWGRARLVAVTSADVYGALPYDAMPINGSSQPRPNHPYAASKIAASQMLHMFFDRYGLEIIEARPFNHIGPGQARGFVVPDFASQIAAIKLGKQPPRMQVGNLSAERDFTDVRDVTRAYSLLGTHGKPGETYLICSGQPVAIDYLLETLIDLADIEVEIAQDPDRLRPSDTPCLFGTYDKILVDTGWEPKISLRQSLGDVLEEWLARLAND